MLAAAGSCRVRGRNVRRVPGRCRPAMPAAPWPGQREHGSNVTAAAARRETERERWRALTFEQYDNAKFQKQQARI